MLDFITQPGHLGWEIHRNVSAPTAGILHACSFLHILLSLPEAAGTKQAHSFTMPGTWEWDLIKTTNPNIQGVVHELPKLASEKCWKKGCVTAFFLLDGQYV